MARETASVVFWGEMLRFHVPKPSRGCEIPVWGSVIGRWDSRDDTWWFGNAKMASRNFLMSFIFNSRFCCIRVEERSFQNAL